MNNRISVLIICFLLVSCAPAQTPADPVATPINTNVPTNTIPTAATTATPEPLFQLTIPDNEIPAECREVDPLLSAEHLTSILHELGYGDLSCRLFAYSPDKEFLTYLHIQYYPDWDKPDTPNHGLQETVRVMKVSPEEVRFNVPIHAGEGWVLNLIWLPSNRLKIIVDDPSRVSESMIFNVETMGWTLFFADQVAWSPDSQQLLLSYCAKGCRLQLVTVPVQEPIWEIKVDEPVHKSYFHPDGNVIVTLSLLDIIRTDTDGNPFEARSSRIQWFDAQKGVLLASNDVSGTVMDIEFSPMGETLAALVRDADVNQLWLFDAQDGTNLRHWNVQDALAHTLRYNPWADQIATAGWALIMWDISTGEEVWRHTPEEEQVSHTGGMKPVSYSPSPLLGGGVCLDGYGSLLFSREKPILVTSTVMVGSHSDPCERLSVRDVETGNITASVETTAPLDQVLNGNITSDYDWSNDYQLDEILDADMTFDENTSTVYLMKQYGLYTWDINSDVETVDPTMLEVDPSSSVVWIQPTISLQARRIAVSVFASAYESERYFELYDLKTGQIVDDTFALHADAAVMHTIAFSPDGRWLAAANGDLNLFIWDMSQYQQ